MSHHIEELVKEFESFNNTLATFINACNDEQWQTIVPEEERSVAVMCHHMIGAYPFATGLVQELVANKQLPPITMEQIHETNAHHADQHAAVTQEDVLRLLHENVPQAVKQMRSLRDDQLTISAPFALMGGQEITVENIIRYFLLTHVQGHFAAIQQVLDGE